MVFTGDTNIKYLKDNGVSIWDEWADENGRFRPCLWSSVEKLAHLMMVKILIK